MTAFLNKHKRTIIFWIVFSSIVLYFAPRQSEYYFDNDINHFKTQYLQPILVWTGVAISVGLFLYWLVTTKSVKQSAIGFGYVTLTLAFYLYIFQNIFLGASLFLNRQLKSESFEKSYQATYMAETDNSKANFIPYDLTTKQVLIDRKLINKLYSADLKQNDTVKLKLNKGLFGIVFNSQPLDDK
jgi:hypothetical protein